MTANIPFTLSVQKGYYLCYRTADAVYFSFMVLTGYEVAWNRSFIDLSDIVVLYAARVKQS